MKKHHFWAIAIIGVFIITVLSFFPHKSDDMAPVRTTGTALIGGDFHLSHSEQGDIKDADFRGRYMLVYFGYTFCPDVCPVDVQKMALALDILAEKGVDLDAIAPLFITLDPERDNSEIMNSYALAYHPRILGLSGSIEQVEAAKKAYRVYSRKAPQKGSDDYLVDHSNYIYLMGPDGLFLQHFTAMDTPQSISEGILKNMAAK